MMSRPLKRVTTAACSISLRDLGAAPGLDLADALESAVAGSRGRFATIELGGVGAVYPLRSDVKLPSHLRLKICRGAKIDLHTYGARLLIHGGVEAGDYEIFLADDDQVAIRHQAGTCGATYAYLHESQEGERANGEKRVRVTHHDATFSPIWWSGDDLGSKVNKAFRAGREGTHVRIPPGHYRLTESIRTDAGAVGSHLVLEGSGPIATTIHIDRPSTTGISLVGADEVTVRHLRCIERPGSRTSACIEAGGTTCRLENLWVGNAKYGVYVGQSSGLVLHDVVAEFCDFGCFVGTRHADSSAGIGHGTNPRNARFSLFHAHKCDTGLHVERFWQLSLDPFTGVFASGDVVTSASGGTAEVVDWSPSTGRMVQRDRVGFFRNGHEVTGPSGSGTQSMTKGNDSADLAFESILMNECEGYGAVFRNGQQASIQGIFRKNGSGGVLVENQDQLLIFGSQFDGNEGRHVQCRACECALTANAFRGAENGVDADDARVTLTSNLFTATTVPISQRGGTVRASCNLGVPDT